MSLLSNLSNTDRYTLYGALFGVLFPLIAFLIAFVRDGEALHFTTLAHIHATHPLLWIIDTAPFGSAFSPAWPGAAKTGWRP